MKSYRENPDGEENQKATRENEAYKKWLLKMGYKPEEHIHIDKAIDLGEAD